MKNRWLKKSLALLLALVMCVSLLPGAALAGDMAEPLPAEQNEAADDAAPADDGAAPEAPGESGEESPVTPGDPGEEPPVTPEEPGEEPPVTPEEPGEEPPVTPGDPGEEPPVTPEEPGEEPPVTPGDPGGEPPVTPEEPGEEPPVTPGDPGEEPPVTPEEPGEEPPVTPGDPGEEPDEKSGDELPDAEALNAPKMELPFETYTAAFVNPLYDDVISEARLPMPRTAESARAALNAYLLNKHGMSSEEPEEDPALTIYDSWEGAGGALRKQLVARRDEITVNLFTAEEQDFQDLYEGLFAIAMAHTGRQAEGDYLLFQYGGFGVSCSITGDEDGYYYCLTYSLLYYTSAAQEEEMDGRVAGVLAQLGLTQPALSGIPAYRRILAIYDYLCTHVVYDYANLNNNDYLLQYTGYAALVNGTAVCQGISVAFYRLALAAGVDARVISSDQMCHAWNIALCDGAYYELDATWDLGETRPADYWYFLKGSAYWLSSHTYGGFSTVGDQFDDPAFSAAYAVPAADYVPPVMYTVSYDPNGGENAPAAQYKIKGTPLQLSSAVPTWDGFRFLGWALTADAASPVYQPGDSYTNDANVTLYAVWEEAVTIVDSGTCGAQGDNLTWALDSRGTLTISGEGDMADYWYDSPWYSHREEIRELSIQFGVTSIGEDAFIKCAGLRRVILPDSITRLGNFAFESCSGLEEITLSENLVSIEFMALNDTALESLFIPASVTDIDSAAFWSSPNLLRFDVAAENPVYKSVDGIVFSKDGTRLEQYPDGREGAYTVPAGVTAIGDYAFHASDGLTAITFPGTLTSIGYRAFQWSGLTAIHLPASVSAVGGRAFAGTDAPITVEASSPYFTAADGVLYSKDMTELVAATRALQGSFTIPASVTRVCEGACTSAPISSLTIPASVESIEGESFFCCEDLTTIRFAHGAEDPLTIDEGAFYTNWNPHTEILVPDKNRLNPAIASYNWVEEGRDVTFVSVELHPVTYHLNGGINNPLNPETYTSLDTIVLSAPTREGYAFAGWYDNADFSGEPVTALSGGVPATVWARWEPIAYTVRFDPNGGIGIMASLTDCRTDEPRELPACGFTRTGCAFAGWNTAPDGSGTSYQPGDSVVNLCSEPNGVVTLYAVWAPCTYNIAFDPNGGDGGMEPMETLYGQSTVLPVIGFTRTGYTFTGWNTQADGKGTKFADGAAVLNLSSVENAVVTLYAQWKPNAYTVRFDPNGGTGTMTAQAMTYDTSAALKANAFKKANHVFLGWAVEPDAVAPLYADKQKVSNLMPDPNGTVTLYAVWGKFSYQIVFNPNGGDGDMADDGGFCEFDGIYTLPACTFTRPGFDFLGWATGAKGKAVYQDGQQVTGLSAKNGAVVTLYAVWQAHSYRVVFDPNGGAGRMNPMSCSCGRVYTLTANAFKRTGYSFTGWNTMPDGSGEAYANKAKQSNFAVDNGAALTLYAQWTPTEYKIIYKNIAASDFNPNPAVYTIEGAVLLADAERPGCGFLGWYTDSALRKTAAGIEAGATGNKTFYAKWSGSAYTYRVAFDPNGGTGTMRPQEKLSCGKTYTLTASAFKRVGYSFAGWNTMPDGSGTAYANRAKVENLSELDGSTVTLYAQWTPLTYKVTYKNATAYDGNVNPAVFTVESGAIVLAPVARPGCVFGGWYSDAGFKKPIAEIEAGHVGNMTVYAKWTGKPNLYTIAFNGNGATSGRMGALTKRACGTGYTLTANAFKRTGYTFAGWNTAPDGSGTAYANKEKAANLCTENGGTATLYAQWTPIVYTITYRNLNLARMPEKTSYTVEEGFDLPIPVKDGQVFLGWYTTANFKAGTQVNCIEPGTTGNRTFYAKWMLLR